MDINNVPVGTVIKFGEEKQSYRVRARGNRYLVCTKPFNPKRTVLYTIIDLQENIRGTENLVFSMGVETDEQCKKMVERLECDPNDLNKIKTDISYRNYIPLNIERIKA